MAQRRMIAKSISTSTRLSEVSDFAKLLFTWIIPHCDDYGHLDANPRVVKAIVVPLCDAGVKEVEAALVELYAKKLLEKYEVEGRPYMTVFKWEDHQTLKTDRALFQHSPFPDDEWNTMETKRKGGGNKRKSKLSEAKLSESKLSEDPLGSINYLKSVPKEDLKEFGDRFNATEKVIESKAEDLMLYCERTGRRYKNYRSFLLNACKRDLGGGDKAGGKYVGMKKTIAGRP